MTGDDIIRMAEQAGCGWIRNGTQPAAFGEKQLERFAALVAAHEREACAKVCERLPAQQDIDVRDQCAAAIRARGDE